MAIRHARSLVVLAALATLGNNAVDQAAAADTTSTTSVKSTDRTASPAEKKFEVTTNSIGMKLVRLPSGEFMMGAEEDRVETLNAFPHCDPKWLDGDLPRHPVQISKAFCLGQYEVTLGQFLIFYHATGYKTDSERHQKPSWGYQNGRRTEIKNLRPWAPGWTIHNDEPAVCLSWNDATAFCDWLSTKEGKTYRLPTEAEWEYACRAGTSRRYSFGNNAEELVRYANAADQDRKVLLPNAVISLSEASANTQDSKIPFPYLTKRDGFAWTAPVGKFLPNAFGLYDMHGNAWEWCSDWYDQRYYEASPSTDPQGPATGTTRVVRGGAFNYTPVTMRCADRNSDHPAHRDCGYGFRVVCELAPRNPSIAGR